MYVFLFYCWETIRMHLRTTNFYESVNYNLFQIFFILFINAILYIIKLILIFSTKEIHHSSAHKNTPGFCSVFVPFSSIIDYSEKYFFSSHPSKYKNLYQKCTKILSVSEIEFLSRSITASDILRTFCSSSVEFRIEWSVVSSYNRAAFNCL